MEEMPSSDSVLVRILKCVIITEISIIGVFCMMSFDMPIATGFAVWGGTLALLMLLCWRWGGLSFEDDGPSEIYFTTLLNGIMINMGGYIVIILILRVYFGFPIRIAGM